MDILRGSNWWKKSWTQFVCKKAWKIIETNVLLLSLIIHKPSLGSCDVLHKIWARSVQQFLRLLDTNRQTDRQAKFIYWLKKFIFRLLELNGIFTTNTRTLDDINFNILTFMLNHVRIRQFGRFCTVYTVLLYSLYCTTILKYSKNTAENNFIQRL